MDQVRTHVQISVPAEKVWSVVANLGGVTGRSGNGTSCHSVTNVSIRVRASGLHSDLLRPILRVSLEEYAGARRVTVTVAGFGLLMVARRGPARDHRERSLTALRGSREESRMAQPARLDGHPVEQLTRSRT